MKRKEKDPNRLGFKSYFGTTIMAATSGLSAGLMTSWFMIYLTDYAGIGALGAVVGSVVLLVMRIFDAVNDPLEGMIMDRAKVGRFGKYKPFIILATILITVGVSGMFFVPSGMNSALIIAWIVIAYLIYDIGVAFNAPNLVYRAMTLDSNERGKLMIGPRIVIMLFGAVTASIIKIVTSVNESINNMHVSFGLTVIVLMVAVGAVSILGATMVKEKYHPENDDEKAVKLTDIFRLLRDNKALQIRFLDAVFSGFVWTFLFSTTLYYIKWGFCADLTTGAVDSETYGNFSLIASMMMFLPLILGTLISTPIMKLFRSPIRFHRFLLLLQAVPCGVLFVLQMIGLLQTMPILFFVCLAITAIAIGADYIPMGTLNLECMDYEIYRTGHERSALVNACFGFLDKGQGALAGSAVGFILLAVGYVVDSATDTYVGDLAAMPTLLNWFIVLMGLIPFVLGMASWLVTKRYPITDEVRQQMQEKLSK